MSSKIASVYCNPVLFCGRTIRAFYSEYSFATLLLDQDEVVAFTTEEVVVGRWFEVFPICDYKLPSDYVTAWVDLEEPIEVVSSAQVWREEWQEAAADDGKFMGAGPHSTQYAAALGQSPESSTDAVEVHAGLKLLGRDGRALIVCSSDNTPFKIDLAVDVQDIERIMHFHTCMPEISS